MKNALTLILLSIFLSACSAFKNDFSSIVDYGEFKVSDSYIELEESKSIKVSMRIAELTLKDLLLSLSDEYKVPIVWSEEYDNSIVAGYFDNIELETVLDSVSRRLGSDYININGVHFIGKLESTDLSMAVFPLPAGKETDAKSLLSGIINGNAKISTLGGQVVIRDTTDNIRRYADVFQSLSKSTRKYLVELWFTSVRTEFLLNVGAELSINGIDLLASFNAKALFNLTASQLSFDSEYSTILQKPCLQLVEGIESSLKVGREVPIAETSVSTEGYVSTTGYEIISDGINLSATVRRLIDNKNLLNITLEVSTFEDISSNSYPIKDTQEITTSIIFKDSEIFLLGGYSRNSFGSTFSLLELLSTGEDSIILIWGKVRELQ